MTLYFYGTVSGEETLWVDTGTGYGNWFTDHASLGGAHTTVAAAGLPTATDDVVFLSGMVDMGAARTCNTAVFGNTSPAISANFSDINYALACTNGAAFNNDSSNDGGTVTGDATFNGGSSNFGTVTGAATFNDSSYNNYVVTGDATFNDNSYNNYVVSGNATFNDYSYNYGGTVTGVVSFSSPSSVLSQLSSGYSPSGSSVKFPFADILGTGLM